MGKVSHAEKAKRFNRLGEKLLDSRRYQEAAAALEQAVNFDPSSAQAFINLGLAYTNLGRYFDALRSFVRAIELAPESPEARYHLALLITLDGLGLAKENLEEALKLDPLYTDATAELAWVYDRMGDQNKAIALYLRALEMEPTYVRALRGLADLHFDRGDYPEAERLYRKILEIESTPSEPDIFIELGDLYAAQEDYERARRAYDRYIIANPFDPMGHYLLACVYAVQHETDRALEALADAVRLGAEQVRQWAEADFRLDNIRHDPRFAELMGEDQSAR